MDESLGSLDRADDGIRVWEDPGRPDGVIEGAPGAMLIIISGPSGVGKDTIIDALRERERARGQEGERHYVVTCTTRGPRDGEVDGVDYFFVDREEFLMIRAARGFLEANEVHGNWYGSPRDQVRAALSAGRDVILKIDVQGAQVVKEQVSEALLIFVIPPSLETLFQRLRSRATKRGASCCEYWPCRSPSRRRASRRRAPASSRRRGCRPTAWCA